MSGVWAVIVGHNPWRLPPELLLAGAAWPLFKCAASIARPAAPPAICGPPDFSCVWLTGVGQDKDSFSLVRCADFTRAEYSPRRRVTCCSQVSEDFAESQANVTLDIFKETHSGANNSNCPQDVGPEVAGVFGSKAFACG